MSFLLFPVLTTPLLALPFEKILTWTILSFLPTIFWGVIGIRPVITPTWIGRSNATGQIAYLLHHPLQIFSITYNTVTRHGTALLGQSIGTIRWYGAWLPIFYYIFVGTAFLLLLIAFIALVIRSRGKRVPILFFLNGGFSSYLKRAEKIVTYIFLPVSLLITLWTLISLNYALPI